MPNILRRRLRTLFSHCQTTCERNQHLWLKLTLTALIPLMIGVFTIVSTLLQQKSSSEQREQDKSDARLLREQSDRLAENVQKETILVTYLNDVSQLLMSGNDTRVYLRIRTKTLTSLRQMDDERKRYLLLFLYESELILQDPDRQILPLLKINGIDLNGIQLIGTKDNKCTLIRIHLSDIYLSNSSFMDCYIDRSNFSYSIIFTVLENACFCQMKLSLMNFRGANLAGTNFSGTTWDRLGVDFTNANLSNAILSNEQLKNSTVLNCLLPNQTWGLIDKKNLVNNSALEQNCTSNSGHRLLGWNISNDGDIRVFPTNNPNLPKCYFRTASFHSSRNLAYIVQIINLENFTLLISSGYARYYTSASFQCFGVQKATIFVQMIDLNNLRDVGVSNETIPGSHLQVLEFTNILRSDTRHARILITIFRSIDSNNPNATIENNYCACYNVTFFVMKRN